MNSAAERIHLVENSLRCFTYGWCSFIPILGLPLFVLALRIYHATRIRAAGQWNPASRYLNWGMILASIGGFISAALFGLLMLLIYQMSE